MFAYFFKPDHEKQAEALLKRAHQLKLERKPDEAFQAYIDSAGLYEKAGEPIYQLKSFLLAVPCIVGIDYERAISVYHHIIDLYNANGSWDRSGKLWKEIADLYTEHDRVLEAIDAYEHAIELLEGPLAVHDCELKLALLYSSKAEFQPKATAVQYLLTAANIFERLGKSSQYCYATYLFKALLCWMAAGDMVLFQRKIGDFADIKGFSQSREYEFAREVFTAVINVDVEDFSDSCYTFDKCMPLDGWAVNLLMYIKSNTFGEFTEIDIS
jgi:alpha-soluble NSF attachment protein